MHVLGTPTLVARITNRGYLSPKMSLAKELQPYEEECRAYK
jgi:hypothetical protein